MISRVPSLYTSDGNCTPHSQLIKIDNWKAIELSSFFEIDFEIKSNAKKSRRFDLSEVIFK